MSDESDCIMPSCPPNFYRCENGKCIKSEWQCDGENDCTDDSDEESCPTVECDETVDKRCDSGECILKRWWCDGEEDCSDGSDEKECHREPCTSTHYNCTDGEGECVPLSWTCDGEFDCRDGSDEDPRFCSRPEETDGLVDSIPDPSNLTCKEEEFSCEGKGSGNDFAGGEFDFCIPLDYVCDGELDCGSGLDESNCTKPCTPEQFRCESGQCISLNDHCDGYDDCGDGSDETQCPESEACIDGEFQCENGFCISRRWRCDGDSDCKDGSDEDGCDQKDTTCGSDQFKCHESGRCIRSSWRCDGEKDCDDRSDEEDCPCSSGQYHCHSGQCIAIGKVCDGIFDCVDGSDERPQRSCNGTLVVGSNYTSCSDHNGGCEHSCRETSSGRFECVCSAGFQIASDMRSCIDIDECKVEGSCSQTCNNSFGSFTCSCLTGYTLRLDQRTCKATGPEPALLFTNRIDIRKMVPDKSELKPILRDLKNAIGLDYHIEHGLMFWSDVTLDSIMRSNVNGSEVKEVISSGLESPGGVAVDWIHDLLYWTDSGTSRIEVADLEGRNRKVIIWDNLQKPRALALHPLQGLMFWTDWGEAPCLESAFMDGSQRRAVASRNVYWPNGLAIDYTRNHLYWSDAKYHIIETSNLDGGDRRAVVSRGLPHPFGITIFEDKVYWTDWRTKSVNSANKFTGSGVKTIKRRLHFPMDIQTYHPLRQPTGPNLCADAKCSHLCLPKPNGFTCACPTGYRSVNDTHCAENIERFLFFTRQSDIRRISFDEQAMADTILPLENLKNAVALDWHSGHPGHIYWSDVGLDTISRSEWDGKNQQVLVSSSLDSPAGLAVDWITNKIYWTDSGINRIEVALLDGSMRSVLVWTELDRPRAIIVYPKQGFMIWTDWGKVPKIERAGMDGKDRQVIVSTGLTWPNGVTMDYSAERIYWTDAGTHMIESCDLNGSARHVIVDSNLPHPFGITMDDSNIYWTDWRTKTISAADKSGENRRVIRKDLLYLMDVRFHRVTRPISPNPCSIRNGDCSHLCLLSENPTAVGDVYSTPYSCACPTGFTLGPEGKQCNTEMNKFLAIARRSDIRVISLDVPYSADVKLSIDGYMTNVVDIAIDPIEGHLYWSDIGSTNITYTSLANPEKSETVIAFGLETVDGIAVDPVGRKLYWTDDGRNMISVSTLDGHFQRVLINEKLDAPRAIALHYKKGYMYWTDWGTTPKIEAAGMDGSDRSVIVATDLVWPNGITIDFEQDWIIWGDAQSEKLERADLDGKNRRVIYSSVPHPYSLACMDGMLYWNDWQTRNIHRINLRNLTDVSIVRENMPSMMGMKAVSLQVQGHNRCGSDNGGCSHLCLRSPVSKTGYTCACPTGVRLHDDGKTCTDLPNEYLLFTSRTAIRRVSLEADQKTDTELPISDLRNTIALDYHYRKQLLFFTDVYLNVIKRSNLDGTGAMTIVSRDLKTMDGIAVDWSANNFYWTDAGPNTISVARLDGSSRKVIINAMLDEPRALCVHPSRGAIFWTDWGGKARIEKAFMDGSGRKILVRKNLQWPNGLTIDYVNSKIFWVDAHHMYNRIETCDFNGRNRKIVVSPVPHGFSITNLNGVLYWTDWHTKKIHSSAYPYELGKSKIILSSVESLMDIKAVSASRQTDTSLCDVTTGYGGCTHLCLMKGPSNYVCTCPDPENPATDMPVLEVHSEPEARNCSIYPIATSINPTTILAHGNSTVFINLISPDAIGDASDTNQFIFHVLAVFLATAFIVFVIFSGFGFIMWRKLKRKRKRSTVPADNGAVSFRNFTYSGTSHSTLLLSGSNTSSSTRLTHTPSIWPGVEPHGDSPDQKSLIEAQTITRTDDFFPGSEECDEAPYYETIPPYSQMSTLEVPEDESDDVADITSDELGVADITHPAQVQECISHHVNVSHSTYDSDSEDSSANQVTPESKHRLLRPLVDKQAKVSVTTTCTVLSEDSLSNAVSSPRLDAEEGSNYDEVDSETEKAPERLLERPHME
ncbi:low-density lipoprotein receptor-related protein 4-like isoform X2 [Clavelina lepadiformis]